MSNGSQSQKGLKKKNKQEVIIKGIVEEIEDDDEDEEIDKE